MNYNDRDSLRALKQKQSTTERVFESYLGKRAILQTYEQMNIHNKYTGKLRERVRKKYVNLINRGL